MKKSIVTLCMVITIITALCITAAASSGGAADVLKELERLERRLSGNSWLASAFDDAIMWLSIPDNAATISTQAAATIISQIREAEATVGKTENLADLSTADRNSIIGNIATAADAAGLEAIITGIDKDTQIILKNASGETILDISLEPVIKQTGVEPDTAGAIILISGIGIVFTTAPAITLYLVVTSKKKIYCEAGHASK